MFIKKTFLIVFFICAATGVWFIYSEIYTAEAQNVDRLTFTIKQGESVRDMAERLQEEHVIRQAWLFRKYVAIKGIDTGINHGTFEVTRPITLSRVAAALGEPGLNERIITIIPGWNLKDIAEYFVKEGMIAKEQDWYRIVGPPAIYPLSILGYTTPLISSSFEVTKDKPQSISFEGYLRPDTYRVFRDATIEEIAEKLIRARDAQLTPEMYADIAKQKRTIHDMLIMASILEREVRDTKDRARVADIFWRRYDKNWALQADSTVHYALQKKGDVFTTKEERDNPSPWNTYRYPGLPSGPISNPSFESIMAAIYPEKNEYWYFLTTDEGDVKYAETFEKHQENIEKYLR